jgi:hypothetical protein
MKLRNKLTGEINILKVDEDYFKIYKDDGEFVCPVTLKELNEGWEDYYEEPKEYWYINASGDVSSICEDEENPEDTKVCIEIGNYFSSREEAEKAVEKLKAWKRLKDKGFEFCGWCEDIGFRFTKSGAWQTEAQPDLDLLFGGEE